MRAEDTTRRPTAGAPLRKGWTTGACATAATKAALEALLTGEFPDPVTITLPGGQEPAFALREHVLDGESATAAIVKDAGDDPDVTHGAVVRSTVAPSGSGRGIVFLAGPGVGRVTRPGLPIPPGEPAINPVPRRMMSEAVVDLCKRHGVGTDWSIAIGIDGGEALASKTWNPRLGIEGGLSVLGTTGIVNPFSCASWIHSIHRGVDVARAACLPRVIAATGSTSEATARTLRPDVPEIGLIDMGDFAGGFLKYVRAHPLPAVTIAGGFAKMTKLAQGALDLHSSRSEVSLSDLAALAPTEGLASAIRQSNTAAHALALATAERVDLGADIARMARERALDVLRGAAVAVETIVVDRSGTVVGRAGE